MRLARPLPLLAAPLPLRLRDAGADHAVRFLSPTHPHLYVLVECMCQAPPGLGGVVLPLGSLGPYIHGSNLTCGKCIQRRNLWYEIWSLARHLLGPSHRTLPMVQAHRVSPADHLQLPIASRPPDLTSASVGVGILRAVAEMKRISALCSSWRVGEGREAQSDFGSGPSGAGQAGPMPDKRRQRSEPSAAAVRPS